MSDQTTNESSTNSAANEVEVARLVRFVCPGHRYHDQIGEIIEGDIECCFLLFRDIGVRFGPCFRDSQGKLERVESNVETSDPAK